MLKKSAHYSCHRKQQLHKHGCNMHATSVASPVNGLTSQQSHGRATRWCVVETANINCLYKRQVHGGAFRNLLYNYWCVRGTRLNSFRVNNSVLLGLESSARSHATMGIIIGSLAHAARATFRTWTDRNATVPKVATNRNHARRKSIA